MKNKMTFTYAICAISNRLNQSKGADDALSTLASCTHNIGSGKGFAHSIMKIKMNDLLHIFIGCVSDAGNGDLQEVFRNKLRDNFTRDELQVVVQQMHSSGNPEYDRWYVFQLKEVVKKLFDAELVFEDE